MESGLYNKHLKPFVFTLETRAAKSEAVYGEFPLSDVDAVQKTHDRCFPEDEEKHLLQIPPFDSSEHNKLHQTTVTGDSKGMDSIGAYDGEMRFFQEEMVRTLNPPLESGMLIRDFFQNHVQLLIDQDYHECPTFQIDYIHLGANKITAVEVGLSADKEKPNSSIRNKLKQCIERIFPIMLVLLYSFSLVFENMNFSSFVKNHFQVLLFLPDVSNQDLEKCLQEIKDVAIIGNQKLKEELKGLRDLILNNTPILQHLWIFTSDTSKRNDLLRNDLIRIDCSKGNEMVLVTGEERVPLSKFFAFAEYHQFCHYASGLLSLAALNVFHELKKERGMDSFKGALDVDFRYKKSSTHWLKTCKRNAAKKQSSALTASELEEIEATMNCNISLSPQQYKIL